MTEYIERKALVEKLRTMPIPKQAGRANTWLDNCATGVNAAIWEVASFPAADVAPVVHGRWEPGNPICPICGENKFKDLAADIWSDWQPDFCPNCGAKMDGRNDTWTLLGVNFANGK